MDDNELQSLENMWLSREQGERVSQIADTGPLLPFSDEPDYEDIWEQRAYNRSLRSGDPRL